MFIMIHHIFSLYNIRPTTSPSFPYPTLFRSDEPKDASRFQVHALHGSRERRARAGVHQVLPVGQDLMHAGSSPSLTRSVQSVHLKTRCVFGFIRSEERRVGKRRRCRWSDVIEREDVMYHDEHSLSHGK